MMDRLLLLFLLLLPGVCPAQARVKEIKLQVEDLGRRGEQGYRQVSIRNAGKYEAQIVYPVIVAANEEVSRKINRFIQREALSTSDTLNTMDALHQSIRDRVYTMDFEVTLNSNGLLSLIINNESCGAYCTTSTFYFNFDVTNGEQLTINDVVEDVEAFRKIVHADKVNALREYKKNVDSTDEDAAMAIELADRCTEEVDLNNFSVSKQGLHIADDCVFPNYLKALAPAYTLTYNFTKYSKHIKMKKLLEVQ